MSERRQSVPGHRGIYRSSSGNYEIAYRASDTNRLVHHVCDSLCGTALADADRARAEISALARRRLLRDSNTSLAIARERWRATQMNRVTSGKLNAETLERYDRAIARLWPMLDAPKEGGRPGRKRLVRDVFPHMVAGLVRRLGQDDVAISVLRSLLGRAVDSGDLAYNAVDEYRVATLRSTHTTRGPR